MSSSGCRWRNNHSWATTAWGATQRACRGRCVSRRMQRLAHAVRTEIKTLHLAPGNQSNMPEFPRWRVSLVPDNQGSHLDHGH